MNDRKRICLSLLAFMGLAGCGREGDEAAITENEMNAVHTHEVHKITDFVLEDGSGLKINDKKSAPAVGLDQAVHAGDEKPDISGRERFIRELSGVQYSVGMIWEDSFSHLYRTLVNTQADIIKDDEEHLTAKQLEEVALQIELIHSQYSDLEQDLSNLEVPKAVADADMENVESAIEELSMAIENRTLALIEFKSIYEGTDYELHDELLAIHVENSDKYLNRADGTIEDLKNAVEDK
ncbi:hypothetical protein SAMN05878391_0085 [Salinicoccus kekensis]|uniref:Cell-wall binding lipoprotein n=2 Tax=Salinicoccus kekensis TaxID=714307 RepID=A0A285U7U0_9STAP|nr:hypothetical protein SAMN05878391_0085 [Salinicoccus kekensis]